MILEKEEIAVLRNIPIHRILGIQNNGVHVQLRCPFHNERTPSFTLYPDNSFKCYGCNIHGQGAIDFTMKMGYNFQNAIQELAIYL